MGLPLTDHYYSYYNKQGVSFEWKLDDCRCTGYVQSWIGFFPGIHFSAFLSALEEDPTVAISILLLTSTRL